MISLTFQLHNIGAFSVNSVFNVVGSNFGGTISGWGKKEKKLKFLVSLRTRGKGTLINTMTMTITKKKEVGYTRVSV